MFLHEWEHVSTGWQRYGLFVCFDFIMGSFMYQSLNYTKSTPKSVLVFPQQDTQLQLFRLNVPKW